MATATSQAFQHLHQLLIQLHDAEQMLAHGPRRISVSNTKLAESEQACVVQKELIRSLKKLVDQNSLNLKSREAQLQKLNGRLNQATSNKEFDIIQSQISAEKAADAELEDNILRLFGEGDDASDELKRLEKEHIALQRKADEIEADVASREPGLNADVARLSAEIKEAEKIIKGGDSVATYRRLRGSQGPTAMSRVEDSYCMECNTGATQQDVVRMNLGEFVLCRACGRILYQVAADDAQI